MFVSVVSPLLASGFVSARLPRKRGSLGSVSRVLACQRVYVSLANTHAVCDSHFLVHVNPAHTRTHRSQIAIEQLTSRQQLSNFKILLQFFCFSSHSLDCSDTRFSLLVLIYQPIPISIRYQPTTDDSCLHDLFLLWTAFQWSDF